MNTPKRIVIAAVVFAFGLGIKVGAAALVAATLHTSFWLTLACLYVLPLAVRS